MAHCVVDIYTYL